MTAKPVNLFADLPTQLPNELIDVLAQTGQVRIERIVSTGHSSPPDFWYDQTENEWVIVLQGSARLVFHGDDAPVESRDGKMPPILELSVGDHVHIAAGCKHRVEWTSPEEPTVWLAVFFLD